MYSQVNEMRDFGNRVEGKDVRKNALEELTLLAVHRGPVKFDKGTNLHVTFFVPPIAGFQQPRLLIEALELQDTGEHYSMRAKPSNQWRSDERNVFGPWPTKDVIDSLSVVPSNLGVLVWYKREESPAIYLPAMVSTDRSTTTPSSTYTLYFVMGSDLQTFTVTITNEAGKPVPLALPTLKCNTEVNRNCRLYAGGTTQAYDIDMSSVPRGLYNLKLSGTVPRSTDKLFIDFSLSSHLKANYIDRSERLNDATVGSVDNNSRVGDHCGRRCRLLANTSRHFC
jgi:hypothetical protein